MLNQSLEDFTKETGIPIVVVVDTNENVLGRSFDFDTIFQFILFVVIFGGDITIFIVVYVIRLVKSIKEKKIMKNNPMAVNADKKIADSSPLNNTSTYYNDPSSYINSTPHVNDEQFEINNDDYQIDKKDYK